MEITTQFVQIEQNVIADNLVFEKLGNLAKHHKWLLRAKVVFKEEKKSDGKGKICDVVLSCPGPQIFASSNEQTFEIAVAKTIRDLGVQLRERKSEMKFF